MLTSAKSSLGILNVYNFGQGLPFSCATQFKLSLESYSIPGGTAPRSTSHHSGLYSPRLAAGDSKAAPELGGSEWRRWEKRQSGYRGHGKGYRSGGGSLRGRRRRGATGLLWLGRELPSCWPFCPDQALDCHPATPISLRLAAVGGRWEVLPGSLKPVLPVCAWIQLSPGAVASPPTPFPPPRHLPWDPVE